MLLCYVRINLKRTGLIFLLPGFLFFQYLVQKIKIFTLGKTGILLCTLLLICLASKGQLTANFSADSLTGCAPLLVQFRDLSTGNPSSYSWDLGNGSVSTTKNPSTIYFTPGNYTVKLVIKNAAGTDSIIKNQYITVNAKPLVNFSANKTAGCFPLDVQFSDQTAAGSGAIVKWEWNFGDGTTSTLPSPTHTYPIGGTFNVTLKVTNSTGCIDVVTKTSFIKTSERLTASFSSISSGSCNPPVLINFTNTSQGNIATTQWSFGDNTTSSLSSPSHSYSSPGTYDVMLVVSNQAGCSDTVSQPTVIGSVSPDFTAPDTVCQGIPVNIVNTSSPATASARWLFSDGTTENTINVTKVFNTTGSVSVKLINNFGACEDSLSKNIFVLPQLAGDFTFSVPPVGCTLPVTASFVANAPGAVSFFWEFGDGATSTESNPSHIYSIYGVYSVKLTVTAASGCSTTIVKENIVSVTPAKISSLDSLPYSGCAPYNHSFSANIASTDSIASYLWNFGDSTTSDSANPVHRYDSAGIYDITLVITTVSGCKDSLRVPSAVTLSMPPMSDFSATPRNSCAVDTISFTTDTTGNITSYTWLFGDGTNSSETQPAHNYADTGFFDITLIVGNGACYDTITKKDYINIIPPIANFTASLNCDTPFTRHFINSSIAGESYLWSFGDGTTSTDTSLSVTHAYAAPGTYEVILRATNGNCVNEFTDTIRIIDEHPDFTIDNDTICKNNPLIFTATNIDVTNIATYSWNFGDSSNPLITTVPTATHSYTITGVLTPSLTITDITGCTRTVDHPSSLTVFGPKAGFSSAEGTCVNTTISFTDQSVPYNSNHPIVSYIINYGDGMSDTTATPGFSHLYTTPGNYTVSLSVTDNYGCTDVLVKPDAIIITDPKAGFLVPDSITCNQSTVNFTNTSSGLNLTYSWSFGDGGSATNNNPVYTYSAEGTYNVALSVTDRFGCTDTAFKSNAVLVQNAIADFSMSDSILFCTPAENTFYNKSQFTTSVSWDFGDGGTASIDTPVHYFETAGSYRVKLTAQGYGACQDSVIKIIVVKGPSGSITYNPISSCVPASINFVGNAINSNSDYLWDFDDGTTLSTTASSVNHVYTNIGKVLPKLVLRDTILGCTVSIFGKDSITVSGALAYVQEFKQVYCDSATVQFFDSSAVQLDSISSYSWSFGDAATSNVQNPVHTYASPGFYPVQLTVRTIAGCIDSSNSTFIKVVGSPELIITGDSSICVNQTANFSASLAQADTSVLQWSWNFGNSNTSTVPTPDTQLYTSAGNYIVYTTVTNSSGCADSSARPLTVNSLPVVNAGTDSIICLGQSITLAPTGADSFTWLQDATLGCTDCANPIAKPVNTENIYVVAGTSAGCSAADSVLVTVVQPFSVNSILRDTICKGEGANLWVSGADNYTWSPANSLSNTTIANPVASPDTTTTYTVIGHDYRYCFADTAYVPVVVNPIPTFNIVQESISLPVGNSVTLTTTSSPDVVSWTWSPPVGLSCNTCPQPQATPVNNTTYRAVASTQAGCTAEDLVTIQLSCNNGNVFVPNTFSPNGDGSNDVFFPRGKGIKGIKSLQIFNRWGQMVFQRQSFDINRSDDGWNGTFKGQLLNPDVFVYLIDVICETGEVFSIKGDVTLIR